MRKHVASMMLVIAAMVSSPALAQQANQGGQQQVATDEHSLAQAAAHNSAAEVSLGALAVEKADNYRVEHFGEMMVGHHSPALLEMMRLVQGNPNLSLPVTPSDEQSQAIQRLRDLSGQEFERAYFDHQVQAHQRAVQIFEQGAQQAQTEELRHFFETMLPLLRTHLQIASEYQGQVGQGG